MSRGMTVWSIACAVLIVGFLLVPDDSDAGVVLFAMLAITATALVTNAAIRRPLWARSAWVALSAAMSIWCLAELARRLDPAGELTFGGPTVAEWLRLGVYLPMILAAALFVRVRRSYRDTTNVTDTLIVLVVGSVLLTWTTLDRMMANPDLGPAELSILAAYAILDVLLVSVLVRLWFATSGSLNRGIRTVSVAFFALVIGDLAAQYSAAQGPSVANDGPTWKFVGAVYLVFFCLAGAAALDPRSEDTPVGDSSTATVGRSRVLVLLVISMLVPPMLLLAMDHELTSYETYLMLGFAGLLTILVALRISLLLLDYRLLVDRGSTLLMISETLGDAHDAQQVRAGIPNWVEDLAEGSASRVIASGIAGDTPESGAPVVTALPLHDDHGGELVVSSQHDLDPPLRTSLDSLAHTVGAALQRIELDERLLAERSNRRVEQLLEQSLDVVALVAADGTVTFITQAIRTLTGLDQTALVGTPWHALFGDRLAADALLERARESGQAKGALTTGDGSGTVKHADVLVRWIPKDGNFVVTHHDVTERHHLQEALREQAFHDALTGLSNRVVFREQLSRALMRSRRSPMDFVVMMIDLDDFKHVNDSLGHPAGDELLRTVATRLQGCLREGDTAARLGGDEFAVVLENTWSVSDATAVAQRILNTLAEPTLLGTTEVAVGASIGVAIGNATTPDADELERNADLALYQAKSSGKDCFHLYEPGLHDFAVQRLNTTTELRKALENDEIAVAYQPVVDLETGKLAGMEALARWHHPGRGLLAPSEFIPLAESSGLIVRLGERVLAKALNQMAEWHRSYPAHASTRISVNVSGRQLTRAAFVGEFTDLLTDSGIDPTTVVLEITESVLLPGEGVSVDRLRALADVGVSIYIDDWGTGWSSLRYLDSLPVAGLKLAQEFVAELPSVRHLALARAVLDLSDSLGLDGVVAEGVETEVQRQALLGMGYQLCQGYLTGIPQDAEETSALLAEVAPVRWPARSRLKRQN